MYDSVEQHINQYLANYNVKVIFTDPVLEVDFPHYEKGRLADIVAAIISRFEHNGNPHQITEKWRLKGELRGYLKIRLLKQMIRIVYKVEEQKDVTVVTIIAVGPKKDEEAYSLAKKRLK